MNKDYCSVFLWGICISQAPALVYNLYLLALATNLYLLALAPNLYLPTLAPIYIYRSCPRFVFTGPGPKFVFTGPSLLYCYQPGAWVLHIPTLSTQFVCVFTALVYDLYYRPGAWICLYVIIGISTYLIIGSCNSSSSNFFGIDNTNICMLILVN